MANIFPGFFKKLKMLRQKFWHRYKLRIIIFLLIFTFLVAFFWRNIFISIYPGQAGVLWKRFGGTVLTKAYGEGLHIIFPWDKMYIYSLRNQQQTVSMKILTAGGLYMDVDFSIRFRPERPLGFIYKKGDNMLANDTGSGLYQGLSLLHKRWGPDYVNIFVLPEAKATMITCIGGVSREKLQSLDTENVQEEARKFLTDQFKESNIYLHDLLITRLSIPKAISDAIEKKLTQEQLLQEYKFRLEVAAKEKERKAIEAEGIKTFEQVSGISILKWRGLEVTSEIARSDNAKVIVIGTGAEGLPVILNAEK